MHETNEAGQPEIELEQIDTDTILALRRWLLYLKFQTNSRKDYSVKIKVIENEIDQLLKKHPEYGTKEKLRERLESIYFKLDNSPYTSDEFMTAEDKKKIKTAKELADCRPLCERCGRHHWLTENCDESAY